MNNMDEILINILKFCERSCLFPLTLVSKHMLILAKETVYSPNVLIQLSYGKHGKYKEFKFICFERYLKYKNRDLYNIMYGKIYLIHMKRIKDDNLIKLISRIRIEYFTKTRLYITYHIYSFDEYEHEEDDYQDIVQIYDVIQNIIWTNKIKGHNRLKNNLKIIPKNILDYLDINAPNEIKYLIDNDFKVTQKAITCAYENNCHENLEVYFTYNKN
jgi:hypothetical protein